jgi:hypothetical protein
MRGYALSGHSGAVGDLLLPLHHVPETQWRSVRHQRNGADLGVGIYQRQSESLRVVTRIRPPVLWHLRLTHGNTGKGKSQVGDIPYGVSG